MNRTGWRFVFCSLPSALVLALTFALILPCRSLAQLNLAEASLEFSKKNLSMQIEAEKVYQAKLSIEHSRRNLYPRLNLWNVAKVVIDPIALLDIVQDIAPFLIPTNWFRLKESEVLYRAEVHAYKALWANELLNMRSLYIKVLFDQQVLQKLQQYHAGVEQILKESRSRAAFGFLEAAILRDLEKESLSAQEDLQAMQILVRDNKRLLAQTLGLPLADDFTLADVTIPKPVLIAAEQVPIFIEQTIFRSPELAQYEAFLKAIPKLKKEVQFSFLGASSFSRGASGGVFDHLPTDEGFGFATATSIKILKTEGRVLELQKKAIGETLQRQIFSVVDNNNSIARILPLRELRLATVQQSVIQIARDERLGLAVSPVRKMELLKALMNEQNLVSESYLRNFLLQDRLQRMLFTDIFSQQIVLPKNP